MILLIVERLLSGVVVLLLISVSGYVGYNLKITEHHHHIEDYCSGYKDAINRFETGGNLDMLYQLDSLNYHNKIIKK